jgi:CheY-like chemotaxis protein
VKVLFLDDMKTRHDAFRRKMIGHDVTHVHTAREAIEALDKAIYDVAHLDHDLSDEHYEQDEYVGFSPGTGMDVVDHLVKMSMDQRPLAVIVHTFNERGREMLARLLDAGIAARWIRFKP